MSNIHELRAALESFVAAPSLQQPSWLQQGRNDYLFDALRDGVDRVGEDGVLADLGHCAKLAVHGSFASNLTAELVRRQVPREEHGRLIDNVKGLLTTAAAAARAQRFHASPSEDGAQQLEQTLEAAMRVFSNARTEAIDEGAWPGCSPLSKILRDATAHLVASRGVFSPQAFYWCLYWLKLHREAEIACLTVPVVSIDARTNIGVMRNVRIVRFMSWAGGRDGLMEHPHNAFVRLGIHLIESLLAAWKTVAQGTFSWRFEEYDDLLHDGDSLSGATAVAFQLLVRESPVYQSGCVVLGALTGVPAKRLKPVGGLVEKIDAAQRASKTLVIVGAADVAGDPASVLGLSDRLLWWSERGLTVEFRDALGDAALRAAGEAVSHTEIVAGRMCLRDKYVLDSEIGTEGHARIWLGSGLSDYEPRLIKLWPYANEQSADILEVYRALWDRELRTMYRVCSSPGADECLVKLRDAGVDYETKAFVMVLEAEGLQPLSGLLAPETRNSYTWLRLSTLAQQRDKRLEIWRGLDRIARGIQLLHEQHVMHRNVCPERVYCSVDGGPGSFRLGGFEWSIRIGQFSGSGNADRPWSSPPSAQAGVGYGFASDWYGFGMLAARLFHPLEHLATASSRAQNAEVCRILDGNNSQIDDVESEFIRALIEPSAGDRMCDYAEIRTALDEIRSALETASAPAKSGLPLICVISLQAQPFDELEEAARLQGFRPEEVEPDAQANQLDPTHRGVDLVRLKDWMQEDLINARLFLIPESDPPQYRLKGKRMIYSVWPLDWRTGSPPVATKTWNAASILPRSLPQAAGGPWCKDLEGIPIRVADRRDLLPHMPESRSWQALLPNPSAEQTSMVEWERLQNFLRCTNQIELIMRQSEIFPYRRERDEDLERRDDGWIRLKIYERPIEGRVPAFADQTGKMTEFFQREIDLNTADCRRVRLTEDDTLQLPANPDQEWEIVYIDVEHQSLTLQRQIKAGMSLPEREGFIRQSSHFGTMELIRRRLNAIDRMKQHSYLMRTLTQPHKVAMDVGERPLLYSPPENRVDAGKRAILQDILRARPIYVLLGPPGTGKTTLVAHLLREILQDDPSAQILVTAQAHGAVDVLRAKVTEEAFLGVPIRDQPISVRLLPPPRGEEGEGRELEGSVEHTAQRLLKEIDDYFEEEPPKTTAGTEWQSSVKELYRTSTSKSADQAILSFRRLVQNAANVVYCTTSAGDLEDLDKSNQSFDWTIIEEAGKVHGYDLALPMRAGHRWLLLGDYHQLPPYRINDFKNALGLGTIDGQNSIAALDQVTAHLEQLQSREPRLVDREWIRYWQALDDEEGKERFRIRTAKDWLTTFEKLYNMLWVANKRRKTTDKSIGAPVGQLTNQYRMHPTIGTLVSDVYYKGELKHATVRADGVVEPWVLHGYDQPYSIRQKSVIWLDLPWCQHFGAQWAESTEQRFYNTKEIEAVTEFLDALPNRADDLTVALLSPYNQQVHRLNRAFQDRRLPSGLKPQRRLGVRFALAGRPDRLAHTVDSFQGNQADIVMISLVRNNTEGPRYGLGFLKEQERMNVLISRAGRMLVLVGCFDFFEYQVSTTSAAVDSELRHLRMLVDRLKRMFSTGEAVRIPATRTQPRGAK